MPETYDVAIIGGGPAGLTAGLYAARAMLKAVLIDKTGGGGWLNNTLQIENYPGFPDGISGPDLAARFIDHAAKFGLQILLEEVVHVVARADPKVVQTTSAEHSARTVIICTGSRPRMLGVPGEKEFAGRGVSYCATCDAALFSGANVAVVGGGNSAIDEALAIARIAQQVHVIHRRNVLRAEKVLQERAFANGKISFVWDTIVERINGAKTVSSLSLRNVKTGDTSEMPVSGLFIFVGTQPSSEFLKGEVKIDERGYIVINEQLETTARGVWAAGDVADPIYRQAVTAAGRGAAAAILVERYLQSAKI